MDLLSHLIWAVVVTYSVTRIADTVAQFAPDRTAAVLDAPVEVPEDLVALAMTEQEAWAQEETIRAIRERFESLRDWNAVRSAFGVGRRD